MNVSERRVQRMLDEALKKGQFFSVKFRRRKDKVVNGQVVAKAGDIREMVCRRGVSKFVSGAQSNRTEQDIRCGVLTVFDVETYQDLLAEYRINNKFDAPDEDRIRLGKRCYRCIPIDGIVSINGVNVGSMPQMGLFAKGR